MRDGDKSGNWLEKKREGKKQAKIKMCNVSRVWTGGREGKGEDGRGGERFKDTEDEMCDMR